MKMKTYTLAFLIVFLSSCERHQVFSSVNESENLKQHELSSSEEVQESFSKGEYLKIEEELENGFDPNTIMPDGKTLLIQATESNNFKMVYLLLSYNADKDLEIEIDGEKISAQRIINENPNPESVSIYQQLIEGSLGPIAKDLFMLELSSGNSMINLDWMFVLYNTDLDFQAFTDKEVLGLLVNKIKSSENRIEFYNLLFSDYDRIPAETWKSIINDQFIKGRYRKAKCNFHEKDKCTNFTNFLESCDTSEKVKKQLERARKNIEVLLDFRNFTLRC